MRPRRLIRITGTALAGLGLLALAWSLVVWQWNDPFTSLYTRWKQRELASDYAEVERAYRLPPVPGTAAGPSAAELRRAIRAAASRLRTQAGEGQAIGRIVVPRLGLDMVLVNGTDSASLKKGPGRDERTYMPGEGELVYVAGHRTTYLAPFSHIDRLRPGDRVVLKMPYATAVYRVISYVIVPANDMARLRSSGKEIVALQACHPRFSAKQRYIVYASPVSITPIIDDTKASS